MAADPTQRGHRSTSLITRGINVPDYTRSTTVTAIRTMFAKSSRRTRVTRRCGSRATITVSVTAVVAWTSLAMPTAAAIGKMSVDCRAPTTPSMNGPIDAGRTQSGQPITRPPTPAPSRPQVTYTTATMSGQSVDSAGGALNA